MKRTRSYLLSFFICLIILFLLSSVCNQAPESTTDPAASGSVPDTVDNLATALDTISTVVSVPETTLVYNKKLIIFSCSPPETVIVWRTVPDTTDVE